MKAVFNALITLTSMVIAAAQGPSHEHSIIVHGTWAQHETWAQPGGDFFEQVWTSLHCEKYNDNSKAPHPVLISIASLSWSGKNDHAERCKAAQKLAATITTLPSTTKITLIAHSHGANICFLASQLLATSSYRIQTLYALGAPIDNARYLPNMHVIKKLYNLFSFGDPVQTVSGCFERALAYHPQIHNIALTCNGQRPDHAELHAPLVAHWLTALPKLSSQVALNTTNSFYNSNTNFYSLDLFDNKQPLYYTNSKLPIYLENEKKLYAVLSTYMLPRTKKER
jgi:hypothetical protein